MTACAEALKWHGVDFGLTDGGRQEDVQGHLQDLEGTGHSSLITLKGTNKLENQQGDSEMLEMGLEGQFLL